jgi:hypothetical protein
VRFRGALVGAIALASFTTGCGGDTPDQDAAQPRVGTEIVQLRRDQVLERIEVSVHNRGRVPLVVESMRVDIPGFARMAAVPKDSPVAGGLTVNLPWTYGEVACTETRAPDVGQAVVHLRVRTEADPEPVALRLRGRDPQRLLQRIADRTCTVQRIRREVSLRLGDDWTLARRQGRKELRGTLSVDLLGDQPRDVSQVAGTVMYGLEPDSTSGPPPDPLAGLTPAVPHADIPVVAYSARCDGHTKGEIKKPWDFLVWVGAPGDDEPVAVNPEVGDATKLALRQVCAF